MDLFGTQPGAVVAVDSPGIPMGMFLEQWGGYLPFKSIITGFEIQMQSGVQFMHSLSDFIYVYVFGERISRVTISGVSFAFVCERLDERTPQADGTSIFTPNYHGLEYVAGFYNTNRVSSSGTPLTIVFGVDTVVSGFLIGCGISLTDNERQLANFSLTFQAIPQTTDIPDAGN